MADMELYCQAGHKYIRESKRGRPPRFCPEHSQSSEIKMTTPAQTSPEKTKSITDIVPGLKDLIQESKMETLLCEICGSEWERESKRGKKPTKCPDCASQSISKPIPRTKSTDHQVGLIRGILADSPAARSCSCEITELTSPAELRAMNAGCRSPLYICPNLDHIRRVIGV